ncbi:MAG: hypothetical protein KOO60_03370 [Gemmatimonadales bacterium]|nr:hypothetical protein [Gemmatimonadales bacterium]
MRNLSCLWLLTAILGLLSLAGCSGKQLWSVVHAELPAARGADEAVEIYHDTIPDCAYTVVAEVFAKPCAVCGDEVCWDRNGIYQFARQEAQRLGAHSAIVVDLPYHSSQLESGGTAKAAEIILFDDPDCPQSSAPDVIQS